MYRQNLHLILIIVIPVHDHNLYNWYAVPEGFHGFLIFHLGTVAWKTKWISIGWVYSFGWWKK